jgi:hypothetical protein
MQNQTSHLTRTARPHEGGGTKVVRDLTLADAGGRVAAGGAGALLQVEAAAAAADAERVRLVPALAEAARTLRLRARKHRTNRGQYSRI